MVQNGENVSNSNQIREFQRTIERAFYVLGELYRVQENQNVRRFNQEDFLIFYKRILYEDICLFYKEYADTYSYDGLDYQLCVEANQGILKRGFVITIRYILDYFYNFLLIYEQQGSQTQEILIFKFQFYPIYHLINYIS